MGNGVALPSLRGDGPSRKLPLTHSFGQVERVSFEIPYLPLNGAEIVVREISDISDRNRFNLASDSYTVHRLAAQR